MVSTQNNEKVNLNKKAMVEENTPVTGTTDGLRFVGYTYYEGDEMWIRCVAEDGERFETPLGCIDDWRVIH